MRLVSVYQHPGADRILYNLLKEREGAADINISHSGKTPEWRWHLKFMRSHPYRAWYLILIDGDIPAGATYVSKAGEIGIHLFKEFQGRRIGPEAVREVMRITPHKRFYANINPRNKKSIAMFEAMDFKPLQVTYVFPR